MNSGPRPRGAVFLDRDGVLNANVFYPDTSRWESPRQVHQFALQPGVPAALARLRQARYLLFLVSNQPNTVNGKSSFAALLGMHAVLVEALQGSDARLHGAFYCTHTPAFGGGCACRKPSPWFLLRAMRQHGLRAGACWMVGDRATDMECGRAAGVRTAWVRTGQEQREPEPPLFDLVAGDLPDAVEQILNSTAPLHEAAATSPELAMGGGSTRRSSSE